MEGDREHTYVHIPAFLCLRAFGGVLREEASAHTNSVLQRWDLALRAPGYVRRLLLGDVQIFCLHMCRGVAWLCADLLLGHVRAGCVRRTIDNEQLFWNECALTICAEVMCAEVLC